MPKSKKQKIYIAGAISADKNFKIKFEIAERRLIEAGYDVLNPALLPQGVTGWEYKDYIDASHELLKSADAIFMLQGWQKSRGSCLEFLYAWICGLEVLNLDKTGIKQITEFEPLYFRAYNKQSMAELNVYKE